jgi:hypothetical protein
MTDAELLEVRESVLRLQMRLHHSHSIHNDIEKCDYKSCVEQRGVVSRMLTLLTPAPLVIVP